MPKKQELHLRLSEQAKQGLPHRAFSEEELRTFLSTATFDGGRIHRYVESRGTEEEGSVADLQWCIEQLPDTFLACLIGMARMARPEKRALKSYLHTVLSPQEAETMLRAIEAIPEAPLFEDVPRFTLPGW
jgi:hypothetical protein